MNKNRGSDVDGLAKILAFPHDDSGPSAEDLTAIEDEWPLIEAEMELVTAEINVLTADPHPTELDWRRLRRAEVRVGREMSAFHFYLTREVACLQAA